MLTPRQEMWAEVVGFILGNVVAVLLWTLAAGVAFHTTFLQGVFIGIALQAIIAEIKVHK